MIAVGKCTACCTVCIRQEQLGGNIQPCDFEDATHSNLCAACRGGIRTVMLTGDNQNTAVAVAKDVGMADPTKPILLIEARRAKFMQTHPSPLAALSPSGTKQSNLFQSALYTSTGGISTGCAAPSDLSQADGNRNEGMTFEEFAAIQHAPSLELDPALYCTRRHVEFDEVQQSPSLHGMHQSPGDAAQQQGMLRRPSLKTSQVQNAPDLSQQHVLPIVRKPVAQNPPAQNPPEPKRLKFTDLLTGQDVDRSQALLALAESKMQCAVTGDSFEQLLQQSDLSMLELVLRHAIVFARMKPHQKGQVMDLLGRRGIYQMFQGQPRHVQVSIAPFSVAPLIDTGNMGSLVL